MIGYQCVDSPVAVIVPPRMGRILSADIKRLVARSFRVSLLEMESQRRSQVVARPRQVAMYLTKRFTALSLPRIGRSYGDRDHTTVIHAVRRVKGLRKTDPDLDEQIAWIEAELIGWAA